MTNPIHLAFVITELEVGGAEKCLVELATRIDRQRFEPVVYSLAARPERGGDTLLDRLEAAGTSVHFLDLRAARDYFHGVTRLAAHLREQKAEIVQTFLFHANVLGVRAARRAGVPRVATGIRVADPRSWRALVERLATRSADRFVCVSHGVAEACRRRGFAAHKLTVIPNGIDVARWQSAQPIDLQSLGLPPGRRAIAFVGRLDRQKGLDELLPQLPAAFDELPDHDLLIIGDGPERRSLEQLAARLGIEHRIHFAGWRADVPSILAAAKLLILPSRWEGMPNAVLEAMAAGKPVVATRAEGVSELLGSGADEQTVEIADRAGFARRMCDLLLNGPRATELGRRNQQRAEQEFSLDAVVAAYERLYFELACR